MHKKSFLIFSGYNFRAVLAFLRFASSQRIQCHIIASGKDDPVYFTTYKELVVFQRTTKILALQLFSEIKELLANSGQEQIIILPSTEALNRFLLESSSILEKMGFSIPLVPKNLYSAVSDKNTFVKICTENGLVVPRAFSMDELCFPAVAKPKDYASDGKINNPPYLIFNQYDLNNFLACENPTNFFFQEYVDGRSFYVLFYFSKSGEAISFGQENLVQQAAGKSIIAARYSDIYLKPVAKKYIKLFQSINFHGLVMIELREKDGKYYMIEANPRLWGPSQFILDSGCEIFLAFCRDLGFTVYDDKEVNFSSLYFWNGGFINSGKAVYYRQAEDFFVNHYANFLQSDVYLRKDSINYYLKEIENE